MHDRGVERWCVVAATEVWRDDMYIVMCDVAGTCEDGNCIELGCLTEVWKDSTCVLLCCVAGVWEDRVCVVLCCVTGVWEDGVCTVLCCVPGVWEDDVVASPSPAGGKDANTAFNKVAAVSFSAAVFFSWEAHPGSYLQQQLSRCKILSLL